MYNWKDSQSSTIVTEEIKLMLTRSITNEILTLDAHLDQRESILRRKQEELFNVAKQIEDDKRRMLNLKLTRSTLKSKFENEMNLIINHPKVEALLIGDSIFKVKLHQIYINNDEQRHYLGKPSIKIPFVSSDVTFDNDNKRRGYWSNEDVHPHISSGGSPCWGNLTSTIAELCAQHEFYALVVMCISYLEHVNIDDGAGGYIWSWDQVDEEGNITVQGYRYAYCNKCEDQVNEDELRTVFDALGFNRDESTGELRPYPRFEARVCEGCFEEYYEYNERLEEYIHVRANNEQENAI